MSRKTLLFRLYSVLARLVLPVVSRLEYRKVVDADFTPERAREKLGFASQPRPDGTLIWCHAASVGESLSVLSLIARLGEILPDAAFLITSGTPTSAELIAKRLPPRAHHQFAPLDAPAPVRRFLEHWYPDAGLFVESELWPQTLTQAFDAGVRLALVNARLSDRSLAGWRKRPRTAQMILSCFEIILTQTKDLAKALVELGAEPAHTRKSVNLKSLSDPLPVDTELVKATRADLQHRPVWVAASTHPGEEEIILDAHRQVLDDHPDLCLILVPRHPTRGDDVAALVAAQGWPVHRRSAGETLQGPVFLADTLGELGSWYALTPIVFLGGSLLPIGGHNPFEVAHAGAAVMSGPHVFNFADTFDAMRSQDAVAIIDNGHALADHIGFLLNTPDALSTAQSASTAFAAVQSDQLDSLAAELAHALHLTRGDNG